MIEMGGCTGEIAVVRDCRTRRTELASFLFDPNNFPRFLHFFNQSARSAGTPRLLPPPSRTPPRSPSQTSRMNDSDSPPSLALGSMNFYASIGAASARNARARYNARSSSPTSASSPPASAPGTAGAGASSEPLDAVHRVLVGEKTVLPLQKKLLVENAAGRDAQWLILDQD